ncbi:MAG: carboxypeptidase regulatory-like domain-containing protein [Dehalococcoidia bacterium]|nr:carboxypeptidase regulatory-like domain-containing protein [Dehalococcoidia bacterium]
MSLGSAAESTTLENAINYAWNKGVVVVTAAGNNGSTSAFYPAYYSATIAVAATDYVDKLPSWSNYGDWVDVAAPGNSIYSTLENGGYGYKSGTSMAAPHVAGLAGLVFSLAADGNGNSRTNDEVRAIIEANCDDIGISGIGGGRVNAYRAVAAATPPAPEPAPVPAPGIIQGTVTDGSRPIAGAVVTDGTRTAITDGNGCYSIIEVPEGTYMVTASASGYNSASQQVTVTAGGTTVANIALKMQDSFISGSVSDALTGSAISGAVVSDGVRTTTTAADGSYTICDVPSGTYTVTAQAAGYQSASQTLTVEGEQTTATLDFSLSPVLKIATVSVSSITYYAEGGRNGNQHLRIVVALADNLGKPVTGASVSIGVDIGGKPYASSAARTGSDGKIIFKLNNAPSGTYVTTVESVAVAGLTWDGVTPTNSFTK